MMTAPEGRTDDTYCNYTYRYKQSCLVLELRFHKSLKREYYDAPKLSFSPQLLRNYQSSNNVIKRGKCYIRKLLVKLMKTNQSHICGGNN